jgi:hypothetical protein
MRSKYWHIAHVPQQCHNSKRVIFRERLLKVLKCYDFLWVQRRHNCSPAASFANCVVTLYLLKVHLQTFISIPITQKCQILGFDTLVANQRYCFFLNYILILISHLIPGRFVVSSLKIFQLIICLYSTNSAMHSTWFISLRPSDLDILVNWSTPLSNFRPVFSQMTSYTRNWSSTSASDVPLGGALFKWRLPAFPREILKLHKRLCLPLANNHTCRSSCCVTLQVQMVSLIVAEVAIISLTLS